MEELIHEFEAVRTDRFHEAFGKFELPLTNEKTTHAAQAILDKHYEANFNAETLKKIHGFIDLTSLTTLDTKESVWKMVDRVNDFEGTRPDVANVAAICVYPNFVETVRQALTAEGVRIASVAGGFPAAQTFTEVKIAEVAMATMQGADEIDIVMNLGNFMEGAYEEIADEIAEIKDACREAKLKVILETGALATTDLIQRAAILALYSGADFIKTSTGKGYQAIRVHHGQQSRLKSLRRRSYGRGCRPLLYARERDSGRGMAQQGAVPHRGQQPRRGYRETARGIKTTRDVSFENVPCFISHIMRVSEQRVGQRQHEVACPTAVINILLTGILVSQVPFRRQAQLG